MKPKQINIDGVLYDLIPVQQDLVNHTSSVNTRYEPATAELKGKEWEILSYKTDYLGNSNVEFFLVGNNSWSPLFPVRSIYRLEEFKDHPHTCIHSVRRLSDNEVFAVGGDVITNNGRGRHKILAFKIIDGDMCADLEGFAAQYEFLSKIQKPAVGGSNRVHIHFLPKPPPNSG